MDFWDLTKLMFRRWYVSMSLLLLTLAATGYAAVEIKPDYSITAYVQLIPPTAAADPTKVNQTQNPWLALGITSLSNAAMVATQDQTFLDTLAQTEKNASFEITIGDQNPVAIVQVIAPTLEEAEASTALITSHYEQAVGLLQKQYGVKTNDMITAYRLDKGENVKRPGGKVKRTVVVVFAIGILLTGGLTILVDALIRRRHRAAAKASDAAAGPDAASQPAEPTASARPAARQQTNGNGNGASVEDWERTRPLGQFVRDGARKPERDVRPPTLGNSPTGAETVIMSTLPPDATIALPRMRHAGDPGVGDDRGRQA